MITHTTNALACYMSYNQLGLPFCVDPIPLSNAFVQFLSISLNTLFPQSNIPCLQLVPFSLSVTMVHLPALPYRGIAGIIDSSPFTPSLERESSSSNAFLYSIWSDHADNRLLLVEFLTTSQYWATSCALMFEMEAASIRAVVPNCKAIRTICGLSLKGAVVEMRSHRQRAESYSNKDKIMLPKTLCLCVRTRTTGHVQFPDKAVATSLTSPTIRFNLASPSGVITS